MITVVLVCSAIFYGIGISVLFLCCIYKYNNPNNAVPLDSIVIIDLKEEDILYEKKIMGESE